MTRFWSSIQKLTDHGLKVAWFGVLIVSIGLIVPDAKWLSWCGLVGTVAGLILRHRIEHLKKLETAPRKLSSEQAGNILDALKQVPKQPLTVGFHGDDPEAKNFAIQIKGLLETAGFHVVRLEGFIVFELHHGLELVAYDLDVSNPTVLGIRDAFLDAGLAITINAVPSRMEPSISFYVHGKAPMPDDANQPDAEKEISRPSP